MVMPTRFTAPWFTRVNQNILDFKETMFWININKYFGSVNRNAPLQHNVSFFLICLIISVQSLNDL